MRKSHKITAEVHGAGDLEIGPIAPPLSDPVGRVAHFVRRSLMTSYEGTLGQTGPDQVIKNR